MDAHVDSINLGRLDPDSAVHSIHLKEVEVTLASRAGAVEILRGIDLAIGKGEAVSVVGPSGSGKTTLLMVLAGLEAATVGTVNDFNANRLGSDQQNQNRRGGSGSASIEMGDSEIRITLANKFLNRHC